MKFKKIMLVTLILLTILTMGAVSASEDTDSLAVDNTVDEQAIEMPVDDVLEEINAEDFNVTFIKDEVDVDDENEVILTFDMPEDVKDYEIVGININNGSGTTPITKTGDKHYSVTFGQLYIWETGEYNLTFMYNDMKVAKHTLKVTESTTPKPHVASDFIELYSTEEYGEPVDGANNKYICTFLDSEAGLNGVATIYANNKLVYTKKFEGNYKGGRTIWSDNLTGAFNGKYNIKVNYQRAADGKTYSIEKSITFVNVKGSGSGSDPINNQNTNTKTNVGNTPVTKLTLKTVKVKKSAKKIVLQVTLKQGNPLKGKTVTFKFNGKKYTAKTNKNGIAKVTIKKNVLKKLKVGKKIKYTATYNKVTVSKTVKVKK